jgi:hypothetical protein
MLNVAIRTITIGFTAALLTVSVPLGAQVREPVVRQPVVRQPVVRPNPLAGRPNPLAVRGGRPLTVSPPRPTRIIGVPTYYYAPYGYPYYYAAPDVYVNVTNVVNTPPSYLVVAPIDERDLVAALYAAAGVTASYDATPTIAASGALPVAAPADVRSMDAIIGAYYDVLSGPRGTPRNWERFNALFAPGGRVTVIAHDSSARKWPGVMTPDDYRSIIVPELERGSFQREIARTTDRYGDMAHVFSTYEARRQGSDSTAYERGIASLQLTYDGTRWWIVSATIESERPGSPIPLRYLRKQ